MPCLAFGLGCAGTPDELPPVQPLCDGSDGVRFAALQGLAPFGAPERFFMARLDTTASAGGFIAIDGQCNFWTFSADDNAGLQTGVIDAELAGSLSAELHLGRYAAVPDFERKICLDAPGYWIWDGTGVVDGTCGLDAGAPRVAAEAVDRSSRLRSEFAARSEPAWSVVRILPLAEPDMPTILGRTRPALAWTAAVDLTESASPWAEYTPDTALDAGLSIEDEPTLSALSALRRQTLEAEAAADSLESALYDARPGLYVRDAEERHFQLLIRDTTPQPVIDALHAIHDAIDAGNRRR